MLRIFSEQISLYVPPKLFGVSRWIADDQTVNVNSRLLVWRQKMHGSQKCLVWLPVMTSSQDTERAYVYNPGAARPGTVLLMISVIIIIIISLFIIEVVIHNYHIHIITVHCYLYYKHKFFNSVIY